VKTPQAHSSREYSPTVISLVRTVTPVLYVRSIDASVTFYAMLGFEEIARGTDDDWGWAYVTSAQLGLLLAVAHRPGGHPGGARGPVQLYLQSDRVDELRRRLGQGNADGRSAYPVEHLGYPAHAPGGELRVVDPDQHIIMIGQTTGAPPVRELAPEDRASILHRAAEAIRRRDETDGRCDVGDFGDIPCREAALVKLTDSWGAAAWACLRHAEEALYGARGVYLATEDPDGLDSYLARRRTAKRP
jgi:catechol 2,3-dioxygenase-like lactoylglutathione lyase family enzyme